MDIDDDLAGPAVDSHVLAEDAAVPLLEFARLATTASESNMGSSASEFAAAGSDAGSSSSSPDDKGK